jgi:hypothetical protein
VEKIFVMIVDNAMILVAMSMRNVKRMDVLLDIKADIIRLNELNRNPCSANDEILYKEFIKIRKRVEDQLDPFGYEIQWNPIWLKFGIAVRDK